MSDKSINGCKIFENPDEAVYVAKSKEDVYDYFVNTYGSTEECQDDTEEQFIDGLIEIELSCDYAQRERTWVSDDTGEKSISSYYEEYKKSAQKDVGVDVIAYLVWQLLHSKLMLKCSHNEGIFYGNQENRIPRPSIKPLYHHR